MQIKRDKEFWKLINMIIEKYKTVCIFFVIDTHVQSLNNSETPPSLYEDWIKFNMRLPYSFMYFSSERST